MSKRVVVIASGETERQALPVLLGHLEAEGIALQDVRIPPRHQDITPQIAQKLIRAIYWESHARPEAPDKFIILKDTDGKDPEDVLRPFLGIETRLGFPATVLLAYAQQHLEAWFFADPAGLRAYLGRDLGDIDGANPDEIQNPKQHLRKLAGLPYTRFIAEAIARAVDAQAIACRSPSFKGLLDAVRNGGRSA